MGLDESCRRWFGRSRRHSCEQRRRTIRKEPVRFQPRFEALEERLLLSPIPPDSFRADGQGPGTPARLLRRYIRRPIVHN